jgi:hypothetical protein
MRVKSEGRVGMTTTAENVPAIPETPATSGLDHFEAQGEKVFTFAAPLAEWPFEPTQGARLVGERVPQPA